MTVQYTRTRVTRTKREWVKCDGSEDTSRTDARFLALGYKCTMLVINDPLKGAWSATYERVEVVADTERGDEVEL